MSGLLKVYEDRDGICSQWGALPDRNTIKCPDFELCLTFRSIAGRIFLMPKRSASDLNCNLSHNDNLCAVSQSLITAFSKSPSILHKQCGELVKKNVGQHKNLN